MDIDLLIAIAKWPFIQLWKQLAVSSVSRYFWPFLAGGTAFALFARLHARGSFYSAARNLRYWFGASARVDYLFVAVNPLIRTVFFGGLLFAAANLGHGMVGEPAAQETAWLWAALLTVVLFIVDDFWRFFGHWLMHRVPLFWSFHRVHHSAESFTFVTADRQHFMEIMFYSLPLTAIYAGVNALFILFTGIETQPFALAGSNVLLIAFNSFAGAFRHGPAWVSFGPRFEKWFISPAMHHVHHSARAEHFDKNMGGTLAIWDRLFGTHHIPTGADELTEGFGLGEEGCELNTIAGALFEPFGHAARTLVRRQPKVTSAARVGRQANTSLG